MQKAQTNEAACQTTARRLLGQFKGIFRLRLRLPTSALNMLYGKTLAGNHTGHISQRQHSALVLQAEEVARAAGVTLAPRAPA